MTTRQSLESSIAARQAEIESMIHYPGGDAVVAFDHEKRVLTLMSLIEKDRKRLRKLNGETEDE